MDHNISLITTLAAGFGIALVLGLIAERLKLPALVGYLVAGILIGPATPASSPMWGSPRSFPKSA
jgi:CPA2 family monovalent cation:H+ antiporter-2